MFEFFKKLTKKTPELEIVDYATQIVHFRCVNVALTVGTTVEANTKLPGGEIIESEIEVLTCDEVDYIYTGRIRQPLTLSMKLAQLFPPALEEVKPWYEKRHMARVDKVLGIMSPQVAGFKAVTFDVTTAGCRLDVDQSIPPETPMTIRLEFDDHRLEPIEVTGVTVWSRMKPMSKQEWVGVKFDPLPEAEHHRFHDFLEKVKAHERGVISKEYRFD